MTHKLPTLLSLALVLILLTASCAPSGGASPSASPQATSSPYEKISADEAEARMAEGGVTVVDVRRADEYEAGHIPGAINIPNEEIAEAQPALLPDLNAPLIVYCRTGVRSKEASDKLIAIGYTNVADMGGIADWPYETVEGSKPGQFAAVAAPSVSPQASASEATGVLSSFTATDIEGNPVDQSILEGYDLIVINVWATYCSPCISEMPALGKLSEEYAGKKVRIVGIVTDVLNRDGSVSESQVETAVSLMKSTGANYLQLLPVDGLQWILQEISGTPTTFFVDSKGNQIGAAFAGARTEDDWRLLLDKTLESIG